MSDPLEMDLQDLQGAIQHECWNRNFGLLEEQQEFLPSEMSPQLFALLMMANLTRVRWNLKETLICISLMIKDIKHFLHVY